MPVKNTAAVERRTDLASLFCMIGRHGPAVALAVIAMVSVVAGFILYRNVRGKKRRKATVGEAAEGDASMTGTDEETELEPSASTDLGAEGSSYLKVEPDVIQSGPRIRHRRSPSAEKPPVFCPPQVETSAVQDNYQVAETYEEEDVQNLQCNATPPMADVDYRHSLTDDPAPSVATDCNVEKPEHVYEETLTDDLKVFQAKCEEDRNTIIDEDVSQGNHSQEEEDLQCTFDPPLCSQQDVQMSDSAADIKLQGLDTSSSLEKPIVQTEEDISDQQTSEVEEIISRISNSSVSFDQDCPMSETRDDKLQGSGAVPDTNDKSDELISNMEDYKNIKVENPCVPNSPVQQDPQVCENHKLEDDFMPNTLGFMEGPVIEIKDVFDGKIDQEEENSQCVSDSPVCPDQYVHIGENGDHKLQVGEMALNPDNLEEPVDEIEDEPVPHICDEEGELEENCQGDGAEVSKNDLVQKEDEDNKVEDVMQECSDSQVIAQQLGCLTPEQDANLLCSQQDWCRVTNNVVLSHQEDDHFQTIEVTEEFRGEDHLHNPTDISPPEIDEHQLQDEHKEDDGFAFSREESEGNVECEKVLNSTLSCLNQSDELAKEIEGNEAKEAADVVKLNLSSDPQQQSEEGDEMTPVLFGVEQNVTERCLQEENSNEEESDQVVVVAEESVEHLETSSYNDQQGDGTESHEMFGSPTNAPICKQISFSSSMTSHPDTLLCSQSMQNADTFPEISSGASDSAECSENQISLSLAESQLTQSLSGFGGESGISSMAVSPDLSDAHDEFGTTPDDVLPSAMDSHGYLEQQEEFQIISTDYAAVSLNEGLGVALESCQSSVPQTSHDWAVDSSVAVNEDVFGNDVEDGYYRTMGQLMTEIEANTVNLADELRKEASNEVPVLVVQTDEAKGAEKKEEDFEKAEISIMEATMDNNEWITDGNYQVLPWMNLPATSFPKIASKSDSSPTDAHAFFLPDDTSLDTDIPPLIEASETNTLSLEENSDGSKKVLAVQPMPQNVNVTFSIHYLTHSPYQKLAVTGGHEELGNWKNFIPLEKTKDGHWSTVVGLPAESNVEWKFVVLDKGAVCRWEECGNRLLETGYGDDLVVHKWWGLL